METKFRGLVHKYGDNINTDIISPPAYMELSIPEAAKYTMCTVRFRGSRVTPRQ